MSDVLKEAQAAYATFLDGFRSVVLATVDADGRPVASYAPCLVDEHRNIVVFVSGLSEHTANLEQRKVASAFFVEDEGKSPQVFVRRRLTYACDAEVVSRESPEFAAIAERWVERFGKTGELILSMADFRAVRLRPRSGRFVIGFGAAFEVQGDDLSKLVHLRGDGHGHGHGGHGGGHGHGGHGHAHGEGHGGHGHAHAGHGGHAHARGGHEHGHAHGGHDHGQAHGGGEAAPAGAHGHAGGDVPGPWAPEVLARITHHMNDDHGDALLLMARVQGGRPRAEAARMAGLDGGGLDLIVTEEGAERPLRVPFVPPLSSASQVREALVRMTQEARGAGAAAS